MANTKTKSKKNVRKVSRIPTKRSINLIPKEKGINWLVAIPLVILLLAAAAAFAKYLVLDRFAKVEAAQQEVARLQGEVNATNARIKSYGDLEEIYAHYTYSNMTKDEKTRASRMEVYDLIARVVMPQAVVEYWNLTGNQLIIRISDDTLQDINMIAQQLEQEDLVDYCFVTSATSTDVTSRDNVTARITVYLNSRTEEFA